jgi:two-component system, OmpR family, sensor histidine kinase KdpD
MSDIKHGRLKVYMGAVPGVGKTYRMLSEAHRRLDRGTDIVIGFVETHGRKATAALTDGLEQIPLEEIIYRGKVFHEMDTKAVIDRHPDWVLVDELAHTNVPGANHEKRWQSINDILAAGINVLSTVNVQHLESMNDIVNEITGVRVRETVPDAVIDGADEVELVDLPPEAIINRLLRGDIYGHEKISQALGNFFTKPNLIALRELVLRKAAEEVDGQLDEIMAESQAYGRKVAHDYIVVCVTPRPESGRLIRRGYTIAKRLKCKLSVVFVRLAGAALSAESEAVVGQLKTLTELLGGKFVELAGDSIAGEIVGFINSTRTTMVIMGQSKRHRVNEVLKGSIVNHVMRAVSNVDIVLVGSEPESNGA